MVSYLHSHALCSVKLMKISFCCFCGFILLICLGEKKEQEDSHLVDRSTRKMLKFCMQASERTKRNAGKLSSSSNYRITQLNFIPGSYFSCLPMLEVLTEAFEGVIP